MLQTNLLDQYVVYGWGDSQQYHKIVSVTVDPIGGMTVWARTCDGLLASHDADGLNTAVLPPCAKKLYDTAQRMQIAQTEEERAELRVEMERLREEVKACVSE